MRVSGLLRLYFTIMRRSSQFMSMVARVTTVLLGRLEAGTLLTRTTEEVLSPVFSSHSLLRETICPSSVTKARFTLEGSTSALIQLRIFSALPEASL